MVIWNAISLAVWSSKTSIVLKLQSVFTAFMQILLTLTYQQQISSLSELQRLALHLNNFLDLLAA